MNRQLWLLTALLTFACGGGRELKPSSAEHPIYLTVAQLENGQPVLVQQENPKGASLFLALETTPLVIRCHDKDGDVIPCFGNPVVNIPCQGGDCNPPVQEKAANPARAARLVLTATSIRSEGGEVVVTLRGRMTQ